MLRILSILLLAGVMASRPVLASPATPAMISEILAALDKGDAQQAAILSETALKEESLAAGEKARLLLYHGLARELLGQHAAALHDLTLSLDSHALPAEERGQALLQRGFLQDGLGQWEAALSDYSAAAALKDYNAASALNNRANIYRRQNRLVEARRDYLSALSADGGQPQHSYFGLGQIAEADGDKAAARDFYAKALMAEPDYGEAAERLAALGGPLEGAITAPTRIVLKPPRGTSDKPVADKTEADKTGAEKKEPRPAIGQIPIPRQLVPVNALVLRPALDQSDPPTPKGGEIQLGAWRSAAEAHAGWQRAKARAQGSLDGLEPRIVDAQLPGKGRYFRLRVSPRLNPGQTSMEICARLAVRGVSCIPVRD